jgi:uncharacterized protein DUF6281
MARVLALGALVGLLLGAGVAGGRPVATQRCLYVVRFDGSNYQLAATGVARGSRVGRGVQPGCNDTGGPPPPDRAVDVYRYGRASPQVALTVAESGQNLLVAVPGRCAGFGSGSAYRRCLQTMVRFRRRAYSAFRGRALARGPSLGRGSVAGRPVRLVALRGVDPRIAVARAGRPLEALIANRRCEFQPFETTFMRCIRSPLWLDISPSGKLRSAAVERPGALVRNQQLRLFLAPDRVADEITSPTDERLTPTGVLSVDAAGHGSTRIAIVDTVGTGSYAVLAQLPANRMVVVGELSVAPRRD